MTSKLDMAKTVAKETKHERAAQILLRLDKEAIAFH
jgi:hypothetical protein